MKQRRELLEKIKIKLLRKREEMTQQLTSHTQGSAFEGQVKDSADEALSLSLEKLQDSLQQTDIDELRLIDQALERIEKGEYGLCVDCNQHISPQRLEHYPYAARCIVCQEAAER
jgi:DnaK suppressor protein